MQHKISIISILLLAFLLSACKSTETEPMKINIIPKPQSLELQEGNCVISGKTIIAYSDDSAVEKIAGFLKDELLKYGIKAELKTQDHQRNYKILLELNPQLEMKAEAYKLTASKKNIHILARSASGLFYGYQSLKQLLPVDYSETVKIPCLKIEDAPTFSYRGMHLDVCRHFMPKDFIKKYIDYLATFKMNFFHWHLTEDQGWRIEIERYPGLTEAGAWRNETLIGHAHDKPQKFDGKKHGGYYTQEDIREIVSYATDRFITIVPEIEMPGHAQAAIASYPELGCTNDTIQVWTKWGISPYIFNVNENTFLFLENVLSEVIDLFPGPYIHIGGDEAIKDQWKASADIQSKIKELGLKDEQELQSYFIKRIEKYVNSRGKTIIGWDEILEGGLAPNAIVMSWRGNAGGIAAAKNRHQVIMTPGTHCYFDHYQSKNPDEPLAIGGYTPLEKVYHFDPVPEELSTEESTYILGAQGNVWTEYIPDPDHVEYMIFPRMIALSEVIWTYDSLRNYEDFLSRLTFYTKKLDRDQINYSKAFESER